MLQFGFCIYAYSTNNNNNNLEKPGLKILQKKVVVSNCN